MRKVLWMLFECSVLLVTMVEWTEVGDGMGGRTELGVQLAGLEEYCNCISDMG